MVRYRWYAGDIRHGSVRPDPDGVNRVTLVATPIEFGGSNLIPADKIKQGQKSLVGALIIEPVGTAWREDPNMRSAASIGPDADGDGVPDTTPMRDFAVVLQKKLSHRYADGTAVENIGAGEIVGEDYQDAGQMAMNYGSEPLWFRFGLAPNAPLGNTAGGLGAVPDAHRAYSNTLVGGDPATPIFPRRRHPERADAPAPAARQQPRDILQRPRPRLAAGSVRLPGIEPSRPAGQVHPDRGGRPCDRDQPGGPAHLGGGWPPALLALRHPSRAGRRPERGPGRLPDPRSGGLRQPGRSLGPAAGRAMSARADESNAVRRGARVRRFVVAAGIAAGMGLAALAIARRGGSQTERPPAVPRAVVAPTVTVNTERLVKDGVVVEFSVGRSGNAGGGAALLEGDYAEVRFRLKDATSGLPLRGLNPAAWMDIGVAPSGPAGALPRSASSTGAQPGGGAPSCKDKIGLYLRGLVGVRPMIDLNSYYLLVLNQDPSLSVIDPIVSMTGKTSLYATVPLQRPAADWIQGRDTKWLYVSMPQAGAVAVVDTETFKVKTNVPAGREPTRVALQRDGRYLWVGDDAPEAGESGVTVIDTETHASVAHIPTGRGHHEIAFSSGDRYAFVNNRNEGTVSVIDVGRLAKHKEDLPTGPLPIAVASSPLSQMIYVADGKEGTITVIDGARLAVITRMQARPGLGPLRFSPDGRWGFGVNPAEHAVYVIDAAENRIVHTIAVDGAPYQVAFTRAFAYVRLLDSEASPHDQPLHARRGQGPHGAELRRRHGRPRAGRGPQPRRRHRPRVHRGGGVRGQPGGRLDPLLHGRDERPHGGLRQLRAPGTRRGGGGTGASRRSSPGSTLPTSGSRRRVDTTSPSSSTRRRWCIALASKPNRAPRCSAIPAPSASSTSTCRPR